MANEIQTEIDFQQGTQLKESGQSKALSSLDPAYRYEFDKVLAAYIREGLMFTADDIVEIIGLPSSGKNKNNAVGALIAGAAREGLIKKIGYTTAKRKQSHSRIICRWIGA